MTQPHQTAQSQNLSGALWMIAAMAAFAVEDALVKTVSATVPIGQILILFGAGGAMLFAGLVLRAGDRFITPDVLSGPMGIRVVFEIAGRLFYILAIALTPLSAATVILQATPLVVVAGAALLFGEHVGWRRWLAILIGLTGVIVILRPGAQDFTLLSLLAVGGMLGFAGRDLASRAAPASISTSLLGFYGFLPVVFAGGLFALWEGRAFVNPGTLNWFCLLGAILAGVGAYAALMKAMRTGDVSAVTPFRYTRLLFGVALGILVFGEHLDLPILIGSGLVILSGLFVLWRGATSRRR